MSDLIDRGDVLGVISCFFKDNDIEGLADLEREINRLDSASPWRRVEDELPDKCTQCLVADADGKCAVGYYRYDCEAWDSPAFGWIEAEDRIYIDDIPMGIGKVVAWVPIEPQKEDENADKAFEWAERDQR